MNLPAVKAASGFIGACYNGIRSKTTQGKIFQ